MSYLGAVADCTADQNTEEGGQHGANGGQDQSHSLSLDLGDISENAVQLIAVRVWWRFSNLVGTCSIAANRARRPCALMPRVAGRPLIGQRGPMRGNIVSVADVTRLFTVPGFVRSHRCEVQV